MKDFDVAVIGAGLAGLQVSRLLAATGASVLLVDRKRCLRRPVHTSGIFVRRSFEDFSFPEGTLGPPIRRVAIHSPKGRTQWLESSLAEFRIGRMGELYERMLAETRASGAAWIGGAHFEGIEPGDRGRLILDLGGPEGRNRIQARSLIGADGARSRVARALGLDTNRSFLSGVEEVFEGARSYGPPALHCFVDPLLAPGYIGWIAHDGETTHVGAGGVPGSFQPERSLAEIRRRAECILDFDRASLAERRGGFIPAGGVLGRISCRSGLLVGDAAGAVSPLTAGGLDGALRLSRFAAEIVSTALEREDPSLLDLYGGRTLGTPFLSKRWMRELYSLLRSPLLAEVALAVLRTRAFSAVPKRLFFGRGSFPEPDRSRVPGAGTLAVVNKP